MPFTVNDTDLYAGLARFQASQSAAIDAGLQDGANFIEAELKATRAHGDQSGATRESYTAYVIGNGHDGSAEAAAGFAAAQAALSGFSGHAGRAISEPSGVSLGPNERGVLATAYTDYQVALETENGGAKATLGPAILAEAQTVTAFVASACKDAR